MVPRSNDQPTDTGRPASASQDDGWSGTRPSVSGAGSPATPGGGKVEAGTGRPRDSASRSGTAVAASPTPGDAQLAVASPRDPNSDGRTPMTMDLKYAPNQKATRGIAHVDSLGRPLASWPKRFLAILVDFLLTLSAPQLVRACGVSEPSVVLGHHLQLGPTEPGSLVPRDLVPRLGGISEPSR